MRGIFGWLGGWEKVPDGMDALRTMSRVFQGEAGITASNIGLGAAAAGPRAQCLRHGDLVIALAGAPTLAGLAAGTDLPTAIARLWHDDPQALPAALYGPFALALLDPTSDSALLAADRIGIEPLFYAQTGDCLVFGSRADAVAAHPATPNEIDNQGLFDYLYFHCLPSPRSIYRGLRRLLPGQCLHYRGGRAVTSYYWELEYSDTPAPVAALKQEFLDTLEQSVRRAATDVDPEHIGTFLSGGTDSSSVSGLLTRVGGRPAKTYSIGFDSADYDEIAYTHIAERHFGLDSHHYYVTPDDVMSAIPEIAAAYDEPFANASAVPALFCARLAADQGVHTLLAGDGGDEIFGGNARYAQHLVLDWYNRVPGFLRSGLLEPLAGMPGAQSIMPLRKLRSYISQAKVPLPDRMEAYNFLHREPLRDIFDGGFLATVNTEEPLENLREVFQRAHSGSILNRMLHLDLKITLADNDLRKICRMCELAGVEVRYPMLDEAFVALSGRVPPNLKIRHLKLRWFFKHSLEELLPKDILYKKKHGFGLPTGHWLRDHPPLRDHAMTRLHQLQERNILRPEYIDKLLTQYREVHAHYYGVMVWVLMMLEEWMQAHRNPSTS